MLTRVWRQLDQACLRVFGRDIVFLPEAGGSKNIRAIFQRTAEPEDAVPGVYAVVFLRRDDLTDPPARGDCIEIDGEVYMAYDIDADGSGAVVMRLRRV